jgi:hypothetical protein
MVSSCGGGEWRLETGAASVVFGMMALETFWGSLKQTKAMRMCMRKRERDWGRKGAAELPDLTEIRSSSSQQ